MNDKRLHEFSNPFNFTTKDINIVEVYNQKRLTLRKKKLDEKFNNFRKKKMSNDSNINKDMLKPIESLSQSLNNLTSLLKSSNIDDIKYAVYTIRRFYQINDSIDIKETDALLSKGFLSTCIDIIKKFNDSTINNEILWILINIFATSEGVDKQYCNEALNEEFIYIYTSFLSSGEKEIISSTLWLLANVIYGNANLCFILLEKFSSFYQLICSFIKEEHYIDSEILLHCSQFISLCLKITLNNNICEKKNVLQNIKLGVEKLVLIFLTNNNIDTRIISLKGIVHVLELDSEDQNLNINLLNNKYDLIYYILNQEKLSPFFTNLNSQQNESLSWFYYIYLVNRMFNLLIVQLRTYDVNLMIESGLIDFYIKIYNNKNIFNYDTNKNRKNAIFREITESICSLCQINENFVNKILSSKLITFLCNDILTNSNTATTLAVFLYSLSYDSTAIADIIYKNGVIDNILNILEQFSQYTKDVIDVSIKITHYYLETYRNEILKPKTFDAIKERYFECLDAIYLSNSQFITEALYTYIKNFDY